MRNLKKRIEKLEQRIIPCMDQKIAFIEALTKEEADKEFLKIRSKHPGVKRWIAFNIIGPKIEKKKPDDPQSRSWQKSANA